GRLTGKDSGPGRLPEPEDIYAEIQQVLPVSGPSYAYAPRSGDIYAPDPQAQPALTDRRVVITAGGTREPLDPVRYLGNRSSGKQGFALAEQAAAAGAQVHLIAGITEADPPAEHARITVERIETADQLQQAVHQATAEAD